MLFKKYFDGIVLHTIKTIIKKILKDIFNFALSKTIKKQSTVHIMSQLIEIKRRNLIPYRMIEKEK